MATTGTTSRPLTAPTLDVADVITACADHRLHRVRAELRPGECGRCPEAEHGEGPGQAYAEPGRCAEVGVRWLVGGNHVHTLSRVRQWSSLRGDGAWPDTTTLATQGSHSGPTRHTRGGDSQPATRGDLHPATTGDSHMATDSSAFSPLQHRGHRTGDIEPRSSSPTSRRHLNVMLSIKSSSVANGTNTVVDRGARPPSGAGSRRCDSRPGSGLLRSSRPRAA